MSVTPWGGLELSGITIPQIVSVGPKNFLQARTFRLRVRFLSLFSRRLVIKDVSLVRPRVVWPQNTEGKWRLPNTRAARAHTVSTNQAPAPSQAEAGTEFVQTNTTPAVTNAASVPSSPKVTVKDQPAGREPKLAVAPEVRRVSVKDGDFTFLDQTGRLVAGLSGVDFRTNIRSARRSGEMRRWPGFLCATVFFWTSFGHRFATSPTFLSSRKFLLVSQRAR